RAATAAARRTHQRARDGEDEFAILGQLGLEDADIGNIERDRDQWMFCHAEPSFQITGASRCDSAPSRSAAQLLHLGAPTASPGEPKIRVHSEKTRFVEIMTVFRS